MAEEQVTAPDQHKPTINLRLARITGIVVIFALLMMTSPFNNHEPGTADIFLICVAVVIAGFIGADALMRRNGLRR